ncbi:phage tail protein [Bhargavaea massiliensis]
MLVVTSLQGQTEPLLDAKGVEVSEQVNGEFSLSFVCFNTKNNQYAYPLVQEESIVELDGHEFRIKQMTEVRDRKEVHAQHIFFDLVDHYQEGTYGGTHTLNEFVRYALNGTGWTFENVDVTGGAFIPNFGEGNVVALIRRICDAFGCEYQIMPNKHLRFAKQIGADKDEQFRYRHNIKTLEKSVDTTKLATAIKGYGANGLVVEYRSPNEAIYGTRWAEPIKDERYTIAESLLKRLKQELVDVPEVSIELELSQLGFEVELGDRVWVIYESLGIDYQARVMEIKRYPFSKRIPVVTLSNKKRVFTDILTETKIEIDENKKETRSRIEKTNERITMEVERIDDSIATLEIEADNIQMSVEQLGQSVAELDVKSDNIQMSVKQLDGRVGNAEATLSIHADEISTKVSKNGVISAINQSPEQISINASKIDLVGAVTVLSDISGNLGTITAGTLRGVVIDIDTDATIGRTLYLTGSGERSVVFKSGAVITTVPYGYAGLAISASDLYMNSGNIYIGGNPYTVYVSGNVDFSGARVTGLNVTAKFG